MTAPSDAGLTAAHRVEIEDLRRSELVEAAIRVIGSSGVDGASVRNIASAAGTSVSSVHYYFKNKEDLLVAAFRHHDQTFFAGISGGMARSDSALERLMILASLSFPEDDSGRLEWRLIMAIMQLADHHSAVKQVSQTAHTRWIELIRAVIAEGCATGEFRSNTVTDQLAIEFTALWDGLGFYYQAGLMTCKVAEQTLIDYVVARLVPDAGSPKVIAP